MSRVLGVDPGIGGALVLLENLQPVEWAAMPVLKLHAATRVNAAALAALVRQWQPNRAVLELVAAMPGNGVASMFSFGHSAGVVAGVLGALEVPADLAPPAQWKRRAGLTGREKDAARALAIARWPHWRALDAVARGQALADAALMAIFGTPRSAPD